MLNQCHRHGTGRSEVEFDFIHWTARLCGGGLSDSLDLLGSLDLEAFLDFLLRSLHISRRLWAIKDLDDLFQ